MNYDQELEFLFGRINFERDVNVRRSVFKTRSICKLMDLLGNPHLRLRTVHVAGTKGKGSIATMIANGLHYSGLNVGVYTSPHLETIRERFVVNNHFISEENLAESLSKVRQAVEIVDQLLGEDPESRPPTFFEMATAAAFVHFEKMKLDWIVLEVGLGGRFDSTNICNPELCVITNISFDHTRQLGSTLPEIAAEKAGIIKPGIPVICGVESGEARDVIHAVARQNNARIFQLGIDFDFEPAGDGSSTIKGKLDQAPFEIKEIRSGMAGLHQLPNSAIAATALQQLKTREPALTDEGIRIGLQRTRLRGRFEIIESDRRTVVLDMAHNVASAQSLADSLRNQLDWTGFSSRTLIFAVSKDKPGHELLRILLPLFDRVILTRFLENPRAANPSLLFASARQLIAGNDWNAAEFKCEIEISDSPVTAWVSARQYQLPDISPDKSLICIAGSAFLCAELHSAVSESSLTANHAFDPKVAG